LALRNGKDKGSNLADPQVPDLTKNAAHDSDEEEKENPAPDSEENKDNDPASNQREGRGVVGNCVLFRTFFYHLYVLFPFRRLFPLFC
jgi:hypothetical protein